MRERHFSTDFRSLTMRIINQGTQYELLTPAGRRVAVFDRDEETEAENFAREWVASAGCSTTAPCRACVFCLAGQGHKTNNGA